MNTFLQAPSRRKAFKEMNPTLALPPEPIITRWGTWLDAAIYYCDNFSAVKSVVDTFDSEDAEAIGLAKQAFAHERIETDLAYIKCNFASLVAATVKLETQGLPLNESIDIIESVKNNLNNLARKEFNQKLTKVLKRNRGYNKIVEINNVLNKNIQPTEAYVKKLTPKEIVLFKFAPTTSADVERSFSEYKHVFSENRKKFLFENLKQHLVVYCNRKN